MRIFLALVFVYLGGEYEEGPNNPYCGLRDDMPSTAFHNIMGEGKWWGRQGYMVSYMFI